MKLVLVEWLDSHSSPRNDWQDLSCLRGANTAVRCRSVGWLVADGNGHKTLVPHLSGDRDGIAPYGKGELTIPDCAITRVKVLMRA